MTSNLLESELLLAAVRHRPGTDWFDRQDATAVHWTAAMEMARDHGVLALLVKMLEPQSQAIGKCLAAATQQVRLNHLRNMQLLAELRRLNDRLRARNIRMLPYKGPTLALTAYRDLSLRQAGDLDLLVAPSDAKAAEQILIDDGYILDSTQPNVDDASAHDYHRAFSHPIRRIAIELHWRLVGDCFSFEPAFDDLWKRGADLAVGDSALRVMSPEDTLIVLAAHGMKHFWSRLGWIVDVAEVIRNNPSMLWDEVFSRAKLLGGERIVALAVHLAADVCHVEVPLDVLLSMPRPIQKCSTQIQNHLFAQRDDSAEVSRGMRMELAGGGRIGSLLFHLRMRERWTDGWRYILHRMFTPTTIEREWIRLPKFLQPLYFVVRPIRLAVQRQPHPL